MENVFLTIKDEDFDRLQELEYFKNRPFKLGTAEEVLGLSGAVAKKLNKAYFSGGKNMSDELIKADNEPLEQESLLLLLKDILDISFIHDKYVPTGEGKNKDGELVSRTWLPKDISPEQAKMLFRNLDKIESFYIKARVAHVLFESKKISGKDNFTVAKVALEAYFNSANYILFNRDGFEVPFFYASQQLRIAATIMLSLRQKANILFDKLMEFFKREEFFKEDKNCILITSLGEIILGIESLPEDKINLALEEYVKIFKILNPEDFPVVNKENICDIGIELSKKAKNLDYERFFKKQKGDAHCSMAELFRRDPFNRAYHIKNAILAYKGVPEKGKIEQLSKELQENKVLVQTSMKPILSVQLNLEPVRQLFEKELSGLKFEKCLSKFVNLCIDCLYENYDCIIKQRTEYPLLNSLKSQYFNNGRRVYNAKPEENVVFSSLNVLFCDVALLTKEGLKIIKKEHSFSHDTLLKFVKNSSFVPREHCVFFR
jgi:hypothetical protein